MWKNNPKKSYKGTEPSPKGLGDGVELRRDDLVVIQYMYILVKINIYIYIN